MCNLYRLTSNIDAMRRLFTLDPSSAPNLPVFDEIYPDRDAPVIITAPAGERRITMMRWGFPPPVAGTRPVTNVRNLASPFWRTALSRPDRRCLVPVTAFSEWTAEPDPVTNRKRKVWFDLPAQEVFAFAGVWRPAGEVDRFAFLTTTPNELVGAIHPKAMPMILAPHEYTAWLTGDFAAVCAMSDAYPDDEMRIIPD
ncbi:MAG: SOS response-associated peptidase family protein [Sphingomonadaceae bacterium]|nr:SOS response-associated peptidase family protein [Sphingomonadaceae bacterium]